MKFLGRFENDALKRQAAEAVYIRRIKPSKRINNKQEFVQPADVTMQLRQQGETREEKEQKKEEMTKIRMQKQRLKNKDPKVTEEAINDHVKNIRQEVEIQQQKKVGKNTFGK